MAPFRSSRHTRNNEPSTLNRGRGGVIDHDPTEGLPVRNWYLSNVNVKQDEPSANDEEQPTDASTLNPDYPWPELKLPSFFNDLPPHSQQLLRAARMGRPVKPSVYDKKTEMYISHADYAARNVLKSKHLENVDSPTAEDDDELEDDAKQKTGLDTEEKERMFGMKKWVQVPSAIAEKRPEPKYLADRRPGMNSLYGNYGFPAPNPNAPVAPMVSTTGFDLGDGSGLGNTSGILAAGPTNADVMSVAAAPVKRMPPKRKKKKLGGPGRKRANMGTGMPTVGGIADLQPSVGSRMPKANATHPAGHGETGENGNPPATEDDGDSEDDKDDEGSGSEEEGSEEGEIEDAQAPITETQTQPQIQTETQTETMEIETVPAPVAEVLEEQAPEVAAPIVEEKKGSGVEVVEPRIPVIDDVSEGKHKIEKKIEEPAVETSIEAPIEASIVAFIEAPVEAPSETSPIAPVHEAPQQIEGKGVDLLGTLDKMVEGMEKEE